MPLLQQATPASFRAPVPEPRFPSLPSIRTARTQPTSSVESRASILAKGRFFRLPFEPEDARLTGVTRSLHRRLLALNVRGSLRVAATLAPASQVA